MTLLVRKNRCASLPRSPARLLADIFTSLVEVCLRSWSGAERRVGERSGSEGRSDVVVLVSCGQVGAAAEARGQSVPRGLGAQRSLQTRWLARPGLPPRRPLVRSRTLRGREDPRSEEHTSELQSPDHL